MSSEVLAEPAEGAAATPDPAVSADDLTAAGPDVSSFEAHSAAGNPVCVLFTARWCAAGVLIQKQAADAGDLEHPLVVVDVDEHPHLGDRFRVHSLPTVVMLLGGEKGRLAGAFGMAQIRALMARHRPADTAELDQPEKSRRRREK